MKRLVFFVAAVIWCGAALAQGPPKIAVCVTGIDDPNVARLMAAKILGEFVNSGRYSAIEDQNGFMAWALAELKQRNSVSADYGSFRETGRRFGADFICVADVTSALGSNLVSARVTGAGSPGVVAMANVDSPIKTFQDLQDLSVRVVGILSRQAAAAREADGLPQAAAAGQTAPAAEPPREEAAARPPAAPVIFRDAKSGMEMALVRGGTFKMGCTAEQKNCMGDEKPVRGVTLGDYYIGRYEVTQTQWAQVMGGNPSNFKGGSLPVENVSWNDVQEFIVRLNTMTGRKYRLPTEAEWEYAARENTAGKGFLYAGSDNADSAAWYADNSENTTHPVGTKAPNGRGLYDMSGNVWEWVSDVYGNYAASDEADPQGAASGSLRVNRGGSWGYGAGDCRVSQRYSGMLGTRRNDLGFRLAISIKKP